MTIAKPEPILSLVGIDKTYDGGERPALDRVSLTVEPGEFFSILGPSGSGKTTMLRMIAGFEQPDTGSVFIDGNDVTHVPPHQRDVRTVFQSYALFPHMTVIENVAYPLWMAGMKKAPRLAKAQEGLELVSMGAYAQRLPHQLSGGQRQRVALARALVGRPRILLLDEPLGALDLRLRQQMQHALVALQKELGIAFVYVTHDQGEALSMSDRVAVMRDGRIVQTGTPRDIYFEPKSDFVAQFVGRSNLLPIRYADEGVGQAGGAPIQGLPGGRPGGQAHMAVRFECVQLAAPGTSRGDCLGMDGVVHDVLFLGSSLEINVRCGDVNVISSVSSIEAGDWKSGRPVKLLFHPQNVRVFSD